MTIYKIRVSVESHNDDPDAIGPTFKKRETSDRLIGRFENLGEAIVAVDDFADLVRNPMED